MTKVFWHRGVFPTELRSLGFGKTRSVRTHHAIWFAKSHRQAACWRVLECLNASLRALIVGPIGEEGTCQTSQMSEGPADQSPQGQPRRYDHELRSPARRDALSRLSPKCPQNVRPSARRGREIWHPPKPIIRSRSCSISATRGPRSRSIMAPISKKTTGVWLRARRRRCSSNWTEADVVGMILTHRPEVHTSIRLAFRTPCRVRDRSGPPSADEEGGGPFDRRQNPPSPRAIASLPTQFMGGARPRLDATLHVRESTRQALLGDPLETPAGLGEDRARRSSRGCRRVVCRSDDNSDT